MNIWFPGGRCCFGNCGTFKTWCSTRRSGTQIYSQVSCPVLSPDPQRSEQEKKTLAATAVAMPSQSQYSQTTHPNTSFFLYLTSCQVFSHTNEKAIQCPRKYIRFLPNQRRLFKIHYHCQICYCCLFVFKTEVFILV